MQTKVLIIAVVENDKGEILLRKKPDGSPPYTETWYLFGAELTAGQPLEETLYSHIQAQTGLQTKMVRQLTWDAEVKADIDGVMKQFVYLDVLCTYVSGDLRPAQGIERLEWVAKDRLAVYDLVPPSKTLFVKLNWL